jgi:hypothetical protein
VSSAGGKGLSITAHKNEEDAIPKPVYIVCAKLVKWLSIAFEKDVNETYGFVLDDVIVEYQANLVDKEENFRHGDDSETRYTYF